ncbi:MAG: hypothetical protein HY902_04700 [Deltaproteobacteria bacterium]|nr:hypothetical protein [Deltaproteobacteria bacterium]
MWTALVSSALRSIFVSTDELPGLDRVDPSPAVRGLLREAPAAMWWGTVGSALLFQILPLFLIGVPLPAAWLPARARDRHAQAMATSRIYLVRMAMVMLKTVGGLIWGQIPEVRTRLAMPLRPADPGTWRGDHFETRGGRA